MLNEIKNWEDLLDETLVHHKVFAYKEQQKHRENADIERCPELDSNAQFHGRSASLRPHGQCDQLLQHLTSLKFCILFTEYVYVCRIFITISSDFYPKRH
jgi:hypothetical protein